MDIQLSEQVRKRMDTAKSPDRIRHEMIHKGYDESEVNRTVDSLMHLHHPQKRTFSFVAKDIFDRIGYGLGSMQYLNIFLNLIGGSFLLIALMNAFKNAFSLIISLFMEEYSKVKTVHKRMTGYAGIIFGLSFIVIAYAIYRESVALFVVGALVGSISVVPYGDLYQKMFRNQMIFERRVHIIGKLSYFGLLITGITIICAGYVLDKFGIGGKVLLLNVFDKIIPIKVYGHMLTLNTAAVAIIISGYILYFMYWKHAEERVHINFRQEMHICAAQARMIMKRILKERLLLAITASGMILGIIQALGNIFYGIFIFTAMASQGFGGWMNVAVVFIMGTCATIISPYITRKMSREYGKVPMLAFGASLIAVMPFSYYYLPTIVTISMGTIVGIIGSSINGLGTSLIIKDILQEHDIKTYIQASSLISIAPSIILIPAGAFYAMKHGLPSLFLLLAIGVFVLVIPWYLYILIKNRDKKI